MSSHHDQQVIDRLADALDQDVPARELDLSGLDDELRQLVATARATARHTRVPGPDPAFRTRLRSELVAAADDGPDGVWLTTELFGHDRGRSADEEDGRRTGGNDRAGSTGDTDRAGSTGDTDRAGSTGDTDRAGSTGDTDRAGSTGDTDRAGSTGDDHGSAPGIRMRGRRLLVAAAIATMMLGGTAVATTASQAGPGELMYSVKRWTESARMALATGSAETGRLHLMAARERLEELGDRIGQLPPEAAIGALDSMDQATRDGVRDLLAAYEDSDDGRLLTELDGFLEDQERGLAELPTDLPTSVRARVEESQALVGRLEARVEAAGPCCGTTESAEPAAAATDTDDRDRTSTPDTSASDAGSTGSTGGSEPSPGSTGGQQTSPATGAPAEETGRRINRGVQELDEAVDGTTETVEETVTETTEQLDGLLGGDDS